MAERGLIEDDDKNVKAAYAKHNDTNPAPVSIPAPEPVNTAMPANATMPANTAMPAFNRYVESRGGSMAWTNIENTYDNNKTKEISMLVEVLNMLTEDGAKTT